MNILAVVEQYPGTSDQFVVEQGSAIVRAGHRVTVAASQRGGFPTMYRPEATPTENLAVRSLAPLDSAGIRPVASRSLRALLALARSSAHSPSATLGYLRRCRAESDSTVRSNLLKYTQFLAFPTDLVHFESPRLAARYTKLSSLLGVPSVVTVRGADVRALEVASDRSQAVIDQLHDVHAIHCASNGLARRVEAVLSQTGTGNVRVARAGVATPRQLVGHRRVGRPVIAMIAPLDYSAGLEHLLLALARLRDDGVDFEARISGGGPLRAYSRFTASVLGLSEDVKWLGPLTEKGIVALLDDAEIYVTSALEEEVTRPAVLAMAHGLPLVTPGGNACSNTELVRDGENGFVVAPRDVVALAERLGQLIRDPDSARAMGQSARERAAEYCIERESKELDNLYCSVGIAASARARTAPARPPRDEHE